MYGPKGIWEDIFLVLFTSEGRTINNATIEEVKIISGILNHPNQKPIAASNFASPRPIPSFFLNFL